MLMNVQKKHLSVNKLVLIGEVITFVAVMLDIPLFLEFMVHVLVSSYASDQHEDGTFSHFYTFFKKFYFLFDE